MRRDNLTYEPGKLEPYWQKKWEEAGIYAPDLNAARKPFENTQGKPFGSSSTSLTAGAQGKPFYNLMMFPYPSAEGLHVGNMYAFTGSDIYGRFKRMHGYTVFEPIGLDGFGIHSENYALKIGKHPAEQAKVSEKNFYRQLHATGNAYDWTRTVETYDPDYYRWTQWLFIQLFKAGLAYRAKSRVNWCPSCKTVLADEQVIEKSKIKDQKSKIEEKVGVCERCETPVEKKELEQWFFRITAYADLLLNNLIHIDWDEKVKIAQRRWIGRSEGARIKFSIFKPPVGGQVFQFSIEVFTTRPDTLFGATFIVLSPEHEVVTKILNKEKGIKNQEVSKIRRYVEEAQNKTEQERTVEEKGKTGVFSGLYAVNPVNSQNIPIWIADYVLMEYGTGAIMGVPAHDQRDFEFAKKYNLPIKKVIQSTFVSGSVSVDVAHKDTMSFAKERFDQEHKKISEMTEAYDGPGRLINSGDWSGLLIPEKVGKVIDSLEQKGIGKRETTYHLRDWLISRQRYWGAPIPMIYCEHCAKEGKSWFTTFEAKKRDVSSIKYYVARREKHNTNYIIHTTDMKGWYPVPEDQLPVELPYIDDFRPLGSGKSPLANHAEFYNVACPECRKEAVAETDVSDTFLDSSWYFLRYLATDWSDMPFPSERYIKDHPPAGGSKIKNKEKIENSARRAAWLPVNMYIGGTEHSVLHLLYARFVSMFLHDLGLTHFEEPFTTFRAHGLLVSGGAKMSKSRGNFIIPDQYIKKYGADTLRCYLMFLGPFDQGGDFYDTGIEGIYRFLKRIWSLFMSIRSRKGGGEIENSAQRLRMMHKTIQKVTEDVEVLHYNTALAALMEYYNFLSDQADLSHEEAETVLKLLAPFAPHMTEEIYQFLLSSKLKTQKSKLKSIHLEAWPTYDPRYLEEDEVTIVVQVNGKMRDTVKAQSAKLKAQSEIENKAKERERVKRYLEGKQIRNVIYVPGKIINFVTV